MSTTERYDKLIELFLTLEDKNIALAFQMADGLGLNFHQFIVDRYREVIKFHELEMDKDPKALVEDFIDELQKRGDKWSYFKNDLTRLPAHLSDFKYLKDFAWHDEPMEEVSKDVYELKNLESLELKQKKSGPLPKELFELKELKHLHFFGKITEVEKGLSKLYKMEHMQLEFSENAPFPEEIFELKNLSWLILYGSNFQELSERIAQLRRLGYLGIVKSKITSIPENVSVLKQLRFLNFSENQITQLPEWIGDFRNISSYILHDNQITSLPDKFGIQNGDVVFNLKNNQLETLPVSLNKINIEMFNVSQNRIDPLNIDKAFWSNTIQDLNLAENNITALPPEFTEMKELKILNLEFNQLTEFPEMLLQMPKLRTLSITGNPFTGLPEAMVEMTGLKNIIISPEQYNSSSKKVRTFLDGINTDVSMENDHDLFVTDIFGDL